MCCRLLWIVLILTFVAWSSAGAITVTDYSSALSQGYQFLSPRPGSEYVTPETGLIVRFSGADPGNELPDGGCTAIPSAKFFKNARCLRRF